MYNKIAWFMLLLVVLPFAFAADPLPGTVVPPATGNELFLGQAQGNQFLAAEVSRQMKLSQDAIIKSVKDYNDENFQVLDTRMNTLMNDIRMKTVLGAIGACLVAMGLSAFLLIRTMKNYSYEKYLEKTLDKYKSEIDASGRESKGVQEMQQSQWNVQQPAQTLGNEYGQVFASQQTQMNAWQAQPTYQGAWKAPIQTQPDIQNPMDSPQWDPQQGGRY